MVYFLQPAEDCLVTISTCNSAQFVDDFDTVLYVLGNATGSGPMGTVACNDDACSFLSQLQVTASSSIDCHISQCLHPSVSYVTRCISKAAATTSDLPCIYIPKAYFPFLVRTGTQIRQIHVLQSWLSDANCLHMHSDQVCPCSWV